MAQLAGDPSLKKAKSYQVSQETKVAPGDKQIKVLKQKVEREGKQRQQAQREAIQLQKELKRQGKYIEQLTIENHEMKAKLMAISEREQEFNEEIRSAIR